MAGNTLYPRGRLLPNTHETDDKYKFEHWRVNYEECVRLVKQSQRRAFFARTEQDATRTDITPEQIGRMDVIYRVSGNVETTKRGMLYFLEQAYSEYVRKRVEIHITICHNCFFVGG